MAHKWFVQRGDKKNGPLSAAQLKQLAGSGQLVPSDLVRRDDMTDWKKAGSVKGLFQTEPPSRSTPPPVPEDVANKPSPPPLPTTSTPSHSTDSSPSQQSIGEKLKTGWSLFLSTAKAAKNLAAAQTRKAKLTKFDLPAAYLALGKSISESSNFKDEFAELYEGIEKAKAEIEKLGQSASTESQGTELKDKVRSGAASLKAKGQQKAVSMKLNSLHRDLGQKAFEAHEELAGPQDVVASVIHCREKLDSLDREIGRSSEFGKGRLLTPKRLIIGACVVGVLMLGILIGPNGSERVSPVGTPAFSDADYHYDYSKDDVSIPSGATTKTRFYQITSGEDSGRWVEQEGYISGDDAFIKHGVYTYWQDEAKAKRMISGSFLHGTIHGVKRQFYDDGAVEMETSYVQGKRHGVMRTWGRNGNIMFVDRYIDGKKNGIMQDFYENGRPRAESYWVNGRKSGPTRVWFEDGKIKYEIHYKGGLFHGPYRHHGCVGQWKNGQPVGNWTMKCTKYASNERYVVEFSARPKEWGTMAEFICKMNLFNLKRDLGVNMWPRDGRGRCFAESETAFFDMFGKPDVDVPQRADPFYATRLRIWKYRCSDGTLEFRVSRNDVDGPCDVVTKPYGTSG